MRSFTALLCTALALAGCNSREPAPPSATLGAAATAAGETGGSRRGDFGPPQGEPVKAVLTSPPNVPPPTLRTAPAK